MPQDGGREADGGHVTDAGSTPCGTSACTSNRVCVETTSGGGACLSPPDGGACPGSAMGACCNTYVSYACAPRPSGCGADDYAMVPLLVGQRAVVGKGVLRTWKASARGPFHAYAYEEALSAGAPQPTTAALIEDLRKSLAAVG
jgi:hypothetical protein